jgi:putative FmdB family regulatory protein
MPFYEYECPNCSYRDEVLQKIGDKPLTKCPSCGKKGLKKLISAPVFRLKGSGWYETDFKSDKENKRNLAGADKEEAKSETKADAKTDAKADAKPDAAKADAPKAEKSESAKPAPVKTAASKSASKSKAKAPKKRR